MTNREKLITLLDQDQFEIVDFGQMTPYADGTDGRVIYLMNDTVESFLVFKNVRYTGIYQEEYEGYLTYELDETEKMLRVNQGETHLMLFFDALELEVHCYDYGEIGHFWVKGNEHLRNLEFQIAIIRDKLDYIGEEACNELEKQIALLRNFPPISYLFYPAVSKKYIVPIDEPWAVSQAAGEFFMKLCLNAGYPDVAKETAAYLQNPTKNRAKKISGMLAKKRYAGIQEILYQQIQRASADYPKRSFGVLMDHYMQEKLQKAQVIRDAYGVQGLTARVYREEPFVYACDEMTTKAYVLVIRDGVMGQKTEVVEV